MFLVISFFLFFIVFFIMLTFQREMLDDLIYGPASEEPSVVLEIDDSSFDATIVDIEDPVFEPSVYLNIVQTEEGLASASLSLESDLEIAGFEFVLEKDSGLEVSDFVCSEDFECIYFESSESELSVSGVVPPASVVSFPAGELFLGTFEYTGEGELYLQETSSVSSLDSEGLNILDFSNIVFILK